MKRKKIVILIIVVLGIILLGWLYLYLSQASFKCGDYTYRFRHGNKRYGYECSVEVNKYSGTNSDVKIPSHFLFFEIKYIGNESFEGNTHLEKIDIPDTVEWIGRNAFQDCINLRSVTLGEKLKIIDWRAFFNCSSLRDISLPDTLTTIAGGSFSSSGLIGIHIPESVYIIDDGAFSNCKGLKEVVGGMGLKQIGNSVFKDTPWLKGYKEDFVFINNILVAYKGSDKEVFIPDGTIGTSPEAFYDTEVESIHVPDSCTPYYLYFSDKLVESQGKVKVYFSDTYSFQNGGLVGLIEEATIFVAPKDSLAIKFAQENGIEYIIEE